jgi:hypothetical protein
VAVAHKFSRREPNGKESFQPSVGLFNIHEYWNSGGHDEDFAGAHGFGTDPHFWHEWQEGRKVVERHKTSYLFQVHSAPCDSTWLSAPYQLEQCENARSKMTIPSTDRRRNKRLWKAKKEGKAKWSNNYLRFNWTVDGNYLEQ